MNAEYEAAKRVALGWEAARKANAGADIWSISFDGAFSPALELPGQYFERGFEATSEQLAQKSALRLYEEEYEQDRLAAEKNLDSLMDSLKKNDADGLRELLASAPPEQWLSLVFLDGGTLKDTLPPLLREADAPCRRIMVEALEKMLKKLVGFRELPEALKKIAD